MEQNILHSLLHTYRDPDGTRVLQVLGSVLKDQVAQAPDRIPRGLRGLDEQDE
jgi:hypothetical protein